MMYGSTVEKGVKMFSNLHIEGVSLNTLLKFKHIYPFIGLYRSKIDACVHILIIINLLSHVIISNE